MTEGVVFVSGASGTVGRPLVAALLAAGQRVRAGVRDPMRVEFPGGVDVVRLEARLSRQTSPQRIADRRQLVFVLLALASMFRTPVYAD